MKMETISELWLYVNHLEKHKGISYKGNFEQLIKDLKHEFNVISTLDEIKQLYEPSIDQEIEDLKIITKNIYYENKE